MPETTRRVDRSEVARRVEHAEKLLQKGKTAEALEEYLQVLKDDPENDVVRQLTADLCLSVSRNREAVQLLGELFERQVGAGDAAAPDESDSQFAVCVGICHLWLSSS